MKTVKVEEIKKFAQFQLDREDDFATDEFKAGICVMLEKILTLSNNYKGYNYSYWVQRGWDEWDRAGRPKDNSKFITSAKQGNHSRIYY
jgi:hypothetical protein